jgi:hypothetical protein
VHSDDTIIGLMGKHILQSSNSAPVRPIFGALAAVNFHEFFSRQVPGNSIKVPKTGTWRDNLARWPFKNNLKKTLSECEILLNGYPKPNQTNGETNDQKRT